MVLKEIAEMLDAEVVCGQEQLGKTIRHAFAADLMSDVLRLDTSEMLLITGLANVQVIRTAEMSDIWCILFVRGKQVTPEMRELAEGCGITLLQCRGSMFKVCGELYEAGLLPLY